MPARPVHPRRAFTLVELLVVIAVIAVLLSLTIPSLARARAQSRQVQCAALLRSWGQAFYIYAGEFDNSLPHSADRTRNSYSFLGIHSPAKPQNDASYIYVLPPIMGQKSWADYPYGQKPTGGIYQCPLAAPLGESNYSYAPSYWGYHSFSMNKFLDQDDIYALRGVPPYPSFLKLPLVQQPAKTILLYETSLNPYNAYGQTGFPGTISCYQGMYPNDGPDNFGDRHAHAANKLGGNIVFVDGHIEWRDHLWNPSYPNPAMPPLTDREWWPY